MFQSQLPSHHLLNALEGVCYVCDFDGTFLQVGAENWDTAAAERNAAHLQADKLVGTNLFSFIAGEEVKDAYYGYFRDLQQGRTKEISFEYRCDAPDVRREMRMCLSAVSDSGRPVAVLSQSLTLSETMRPVVSLFDTAYLQSLAGSRNDLPILRMCSYCHDVKVSGAADEWRSPEAYYRAGGTSQVRISHGICPACFQKSVLRDEP